jgi:hypothetical protein
MKTSERERHDCYVLVYLSIFIQKNKCVLFMLEFNYKGLLIPETIIKSTLDEFKNEFSIKLNTGKREDLFNQYQLYCENLKALCGNRPLIQWIDGSYVTQNKNPSDIDLVTLIDYNIIKVKEEELKKFTFPQSMETYQIDAYIIAVHPEDDKLYFVTQSDRSYWIDHFGKTKPNKYRKRIPKGFLEIII